MKKETFYLTTTLPYVNALPHIGHALEFIQADTIVRFQRKQKGRENVWFNIGTDEHGLKNAQAAEKEGITPKEYVDILAKKWREFAELFSISYDTFYRTSDTKHYTSATKFWNTSKKAGDIYKKKYSGWYCVSCEEFKTEKEIKNGRCILHPTKDLLWMEEENYFFKLSKYKDKLLTWLDENPETLKPKQALNELKNWIKDMEDISISRSKENLKWGIDVPGDDSQVMYVWFDALTNYVNVLGYGNEDESKVENNDRSLDKWWPGVQIFGVDNLRFQGAIWQGMLASAGLPNTQKLLRHGFILGPDGTKMSKSIGNVVSPFDQQEKFGTEPVRFYLIAGISTFSDSPYKEEDLVNLYNSHLANNFGNLLNRVIHLANKLEVEINEFDTIEAEFEKKVLDFKSSTLGLFNEYELNKAAEKINELATFGNEYITEKEPWGKEVSKKNAEVILNNLSFLLYVVIDLYEPIIPESCTKAKIMLSKREKGILFEKLEHAT